MGTLSLYLHAKRSLFSFFVCGSGGGVFRYSITWFHWDSSIALYYIRYIVEGAILKLRERENMSLWLLICFEIFWYSPNVSLFGGENLIDDIYPFCLSVDSLIMRLFGSASRVIFIREFEASALSHRIYNCPWQCSIGWQWTKAISFVSVCRLPLLFVAGLFPICLESEISESLHCGVCAVYPFFEFVFLTQWMSWYLIHRSHGPLHYLQICILHFVLFFDCFRSHIHSPPLFAGRDLYHLLQCIISIESASFDSKPCAQVVHTIHI